MNALRRVLCGIVAVVCGSTAFAQNLLIEDYRVPVSSATSWRANLDYHYKRVGAVESENRGTFYTDYRYFYDSLRFAYSGDLRLSADKAEREEFASFLSNESVKAYVISGRDVFVGGEFRRQFGSETDGAADVAATFGYGRFVNVTPLAKAVRMEDWLLELDQLTDDLPAETMIALAQIIQREGEFRDRFDETYRQHWFEAMEESVRSSGLMKNARLDAVALSRMRDVLSRERVFDRFVGWELKAGTSVSILDAPAKADAVGRVAEASLRFAKPFGWRVQWNEKAFAASFVGDDFADRYTVNVDSDLSYELSDRIDLLVSHSFAAAREREATAVGSNAGAFRTTTAHRLQGSVVYSVENALTLNLNGVVSASEGRTRQSLTLTFGFRFL